MEAKVNELRGILKPSPSTQPTAREIAIQHAKFLEHRKELEAQILDIHFKNPSPSDIADFKANVRLFQPSDYDDLIEERNAADWAGREWKLTSSGEIVKRKDLEMWCSQPCARRALFVKVQLNETAAWERAGIPDIQIDLLDEDKSAETEADRNARKLGELKLEDQRQAARDSAALAAERGERGAAQNIDKVKITLKEKDVAAPSEIIPTITVDGQEDHLYVDGFKAKLPERRKGKPSTE
ncbi:hypothetical protein PT974_09579 [Cladobotryum mycophilum]|uniref:protein-serine/threonine phosphatase n=1 Tax=Cladobotryum mycophilum TaxID=491253 RepID=A0ABR0SGI6_9HYPO